jgi:hypothetical protein
MNALPYVYKLYFNVVFKIGEQSNISPVMKTDMHVAFTPVLQGFSVEAEVMSILIEETV